MKRLILATATAAAMLLGTAAQAGPFILAGTDADDHGNATATANLNGWLFMQRALENLAPSVTNGNKVVTILGSTGGALAAATSAFNLSGLAATWSLQTVSTANFATFFGGGLASSGILMMDSGSNLGGGVTGNNFVPYATDINNFLGGGGGLFSQANGYQWLTTLVPTLTVVNQSNTGLTLTGAGNSSFPGLTNSDLSAGPYHNAFANTGAIPILATGTASGSAVIIGGVTGTITDPGGVVPEPGTLALFAVALGAIGIARRKKSS